jgi:AbrB family looped-hinge helix DNA binding protein
MAAPKGKHIFGTVKVGEKGQIVIPKEARQVFGIKPGDSLLVLGDEAQGIAIVKSNIFMNMISKMMVSPNATDSEKEFAKDVLDVEKKGEE